jgi:hypothetical protein
MRCEVCKRELAEHEAVYRATIARDNSFSLFHGKVGSVCTDCATTIAGCQWVSRLCSNCQRLTFFARLRKNLRYVFCGIECRQAASNARRLKKWMTPRPCAICGQDFTPRSYYARHCSMTCKVEAYQKASTAMSSRTADEARRQRRLENVDALEYPCRNCRRPLGRHRVNGSWLCCECHVKAGHQPAEWHPECMAAAAALGKTQR